MPTEKASEFVDFPLILQSGCFYIRDPSVFINKIKSHKNMRSNLILVTVDVADLYPNINMNQA